MREQDRRLDILNALLTTPHRDLASVWPVHSDLIAKDPLFYVRLAAWYIDNRDVRDHRDMFVVALVLSDFPGHRDVGLAMLRKMPPYQVVRVIDFISGRTTKRRAGAESRNGKHNGSRGNHGTGGRHARKNAVRRLLHGSTAKQDNNARGPEMVTESYGLFRNVPRSVKTEVTRYLRQREADHDWFDSSVLIARKAMKRLYALLHVKPSDRAQQILFENDPPEDSRLHALRELASAGAPADQARAIVEHKIPYRVASTVVRQMTPTVLVALIEQMSPQELINNMGSLKRRGALDDADIKAMVEAKLCDAKNAKRVSALKASLAADVAGVSDDVREKLEAVADQQIKAKGRISRPTALLVDKSASMETAIELGKRIGAMLSAVCESELYVYAFDTMAYEIQPSGDELADWERAFTGIKASGCTSCGVAVANLTRKRQRVEQIIMITDEGHNTPPALLMSLNEYRDTMNVEPNFCIVRTPKGCNAMEDMLSRNGWPVDVFPFAGDYYSLPNLIPLLAKPSKMDLLMEIMDYKLPQRQAA